MAAHDQRAHAEWSASASARNSVCAGAIAMSSMVDSRESEAAAWGTVAHEIADHCLRDNKDPSEFLGMEGKSGKFRFEVDADMVACVEAYVDRCAEEIAAEPCVFWVEESLPLDKLDPPLPAGGTGDLVLYRPQSKLLKVKDLKTGRGVFVDAKGSMQMRAYALGAVLAHPDLDVETIEVEIIQPRLERDGDGGIRSERFHIADLYEWAGTLLTAMQRAADAKAEFVEIKGNRVLFDEWADRWLTTGQCTFCDAKALCPKFRAEALSTLPKRASEWFETPTDERPPEMSNSALLLSTEELTHALNGLDAIEAWAKAVRERAHAEAERGAQLKGWKLVEKIGNRAWKDADAAEKALAVLGVPVDKLHVRKLVTPAAADKLLGKRKNEIVDLVERPVRGLNLVREETSGRPAVAGKAAQHFEALE